MAISVASRTRATSSRAYDPADQPVDFLADLVLDERRDVFFRSGRAPASRLGSSGEDRFVDGNELVAQRAELLVGIHPRWNLSSRLPERSCTVLVLPATFVVKA
jgi:hypothetical protein